MAEQTMRGSAGITSRAATAQEVERFRRAQTTTASMGGHPLTPEDIAHARRQMLDNAKPMGEALARHVYDSSHEDPVHEQTNPSDYRPVEFTGSRLPQVDLVQQQQADPVVVSELAAKTISAAEDAAYHVESMVASVATLAGEIGSEGAALANLIRRRGSAFAKLVTQFSELAERTRAHLAEEAGALADGAATSKQT